MPTRSARPVYVIIALVAAWTLGVGGMMNGCATLQFYRQTTHPSIKLDSRMAPELRSHVEAQYAARNEALNVNHKRMIPIAAANVLLSGLLIIACARALSGRPGAHHLALQAIGANIVFAIIDYFGSTPVRQAIIAAGSQHPPGDVNTLDAAQVAFIYHWLFRLATGAQAIMLSLAAYALTRPRVLASYKIEEETDEDEDL